MKPTSAIASFQIASTARPVRSSSATIPARRFRQFRDRCRLRFRDRVDERAAALVESGDAFARIAGEIEQEFGAGRVEATDAARIDRTRGAAAFDFVDALVQRRHRRQRPVAAGYCVTAGIDIECARFCHGARLQGGGPARNVRAAESVHGALTRTTCRPRRRVCRPRRRSCARRVPRAGTARPEAR